MLINKKSYKNVDIYCHIFFCFGSLHDLRSKKCIINMSETHGPPNLRDGGVGWLVLGVRTGAGAKGVESTLHPAAAVRITQPHQNCATKFSFETLKLHTDVSLCFGVYFWQQNIEWTQRKQNWKKAKSSMVRFRQLNMKWMPCQCGVVVVFSFERESSLFPLCMQFVWYILSVMPRWKKWCESDKRWQPLTQ